MNDKTYHDTYTKKTPIPEGGHVVFEFPSIYNGDQSQHLEIIREDDGIVIRCTQGRLCIWPTVSNVIKVTTSP